MIYFILALAFAVVLVSYAAAAVALNGGKHIPMTVKPESLGLPYEAVEFRSADAVLLKGWLIPAASESRRTIVFCHGWGANKGEVLKNTHFLRDAGFNLFYFDFRCCGESSGEMLSVGALEARDLDAAIGFLRRTRPSDRLAVYGISMGSMVAFAGLARHPQLEAAVVECPFSSHNAALTRYAWAKFYLSYYPFMPLVFFFVKRRLGFDPEEITSPERMIGRIGKVPVLAVCGEADPIAVPEFGRRLMESLPRRGECWVVPGAGHARCAEAAGPAYQEKLRAFYCASFACA